MRTAGVQFHEVSIPLDQPLRWSGGVNRGWTRTIVRVQTDAGIAETLGGMPALVPLDALREQRLPR